MCCAHARCSIVGRNKRRRRRSKLAFDPSEPQSRIVVLADNLNNRSDCLDGGDRGKSADRDPTRLVREGNARDGGNNVLVKGRCCVGGDNSSSRDAFKMSISNASPRCIAARVSAYNLAVYLARSSITSILRR